MLYRRMRPGHRHCPPASPALGAQQARMSAQELVGLNPQIKGLKVHSQLMEGTELFLVDQACDGCLVPDGKGRARIAFF